MDKETIARLKGKVVDVGDVPVHSKVVIYGDPGVGKTTLASLAPKPLIINAEGGTLSLNLFRNHFDKFDFKTMKVESIQDLQDIFWYLKSGNHDRQTVIIDSLTEIQQVSMDEVLSDPRRDDKHDPDTPIISDYGKNTNRMRKIIRNFRDLPMNVVFTCLAEERKDEDTGSVKIQPALTPRIAQDLMGYVDVVGYMYTTKVKDKGTVRRLLTQPKGKFVAKDRSGKLGEVMENPTMFDIISKVSSGSVEVPGELDKILEEVFGNES